MLIGDELSLDGDEMASVFAKYFPLKFCFDDYMQTKPHMCTLPISKTSTSHLEESQERGTCKMNLWQIIAAARV